MECWPSRHLLWSVTATVWSPLNMNKPVMRTRIITNTKTYKTHPHWLHKPTKWLSASSLLYIPNDSISPLSDSQHHYYNTFTLTPQTHRVTASSIIITLSHWLHKPNEWLPESSSESSLKLFPTAQILSTFNIKYSPPTLSLSLCLAETKCYPVTGWMHVKH